MNLLNYTAPNEGNESNLQGMATTSCSQYPADYLLSSILLSIFVYRRTKKWETFEWTAKKIFNKQYTRPEQTPKPNRRVK